MKNDRALAWFRTLAWIIAVIGLALTPYALKGATVMVINGDPPGVGFNDPTPISPVGGNTGTTLGQQRMIAFQAAADKWGATLGSNLPIRISAAWTPMPCNDFAAVLGSAGPTGIYKDFQGAPAGARWYPKALANKLAGTDMNPTNVDIEAILNVNVGQAGCLTGHFFYLGLDNNHGNNSDFVAMVTHELAHGLGFLTFTNGQTGATAGGFLSIWDDFLLDNTTNKTWSMMTDAERAASAVNTGNLVWNGGNVTAAIPQVLRPAGSSFAGADAQGRGLMFNPAGFLPGSSIVHFDMSMFPNQLMEPALNYDLTHEVTPPNDLTFPLLKDIGWTQGSGSSNPDLTISKTHVGNFTQGQASASYTITATNSGTGPTSGTVTVKDTVPTDLTPTAIGGTGWNCTQPSGPCSRSDTLAAGGSYQAITMTVKVAANAPATVTNTATISGGGELNTANDTASDLTVIVQVPSLTITSNHSGAFQNGQTGAAYTVTVTNVGGGATSGIVTVTESVPSALTLVSMSGAGWTCTVLPTCTNSTPLAAGSSYSPITVIVNVAANATSPQVNAVSVSGGGSAGANTTDSTTITVPNPPVLSIAKTHSGSFTPGQQNVTYQVTVTNAANAGTTSGVVTVSESVPSGLTLVSMSGSGWTCTTLPACTNSAPLAAGASYSPITVTVNVAANTTSPQVNAVSVSGGGSAGANTTDSTTITSKPAVLSIAKMHSGSFTPGQQNATYQVTVTNAANAGTTSGVVTVTESVPSGLLLVSMTGTGWTCEVLPVCTNPNPLAGGASYSPITVTVNVTANATSPQVNAVSVSGGGSSGANTTDSTTITSNPAVLSIVKTHSGSFTQGQQNVSYQVTVTNAANAGTTSGVVTVTESLPAGLTLVSMSGAGWTCTTLPTCTNSAPLAGGGSYSPITVTVNVAANATSPQVNAVSVSGGGSVSANTTDSTTITPKPAVLSIAKTHSGSFTPGQQNVTYQVTVTNAASAGTTSGVVTVSESVPSGLTLVSMSGSGWTCTTLPACTNSAPLAGGASYSPITVTVNVAANATSPQVNAVSVSGGGSAGANTTDSTTITSKPAVLSIAKTHSGSFTPGQQNATYQVTVTNAANAGTTSGVVTVTESVPSGLLLVSMTGTGWTCEVLPVCTNPNPLAGGASYSPITVTVNVTANATSPQVNAVSVSGGGSVGVNTTDSTTITTNPAVLSIVKTHSGSFTQGQQNATYQVTVTNAAVAGTTSGAVTVSESVPSGLNLVSMSGAGWTCTTLPTCTNSAPLAGGASYSPITVTVNVTANATSPQMNAVSVSGGGSVSANTTDSTTITPKPAVLSIVKTHSGSFTPGQQNATYQVTVTNAANAGATSGVVTVIESVPSGLLLVSMTGTGWTCEVLPVCTNPNPLAGGASYSPITVTVNVTANATSPQVNAVSVSGGGSAGANTTDSTTITAVTPNLPLLSITPAHGAGFTQGQQNATYQLTVSNAAGAGSTGGTVTVTDTMPTGLILVSMSGAGWTCTVLPTCTNGTPLAGGASYPAITVTVNVAANAISPQVHIASVSGGGSLTASTNDAIPIVSQASGPPLPTGAQPFSGNSSNPAITFTFTDPRGYQDLGVVNVLVNNFLDGRNACYLAYSQPSGILYLVDDFGVLLPGAVLTSSGSRSNSQCTVNWDSNAVSGVGNTLNLTLTITFKSAFAGNKVIYAAARDVAESNSGWVALGVWTVPGGQPGTTAAVGMTPARGSGSGPIPVTFNFSDTKGFQDLGVENILVNNFLDGRHACYLAYARSINTLYLVNDNGDGLLPGKDLGTGGTLSNGQCTVTWGSSPVTAGGNNLSLTLNMAFSANFAGGRVFYLAARDVNEANNTGWQSLGSWFVQ